MKTLDLPLQATKDFTQFKGNHRFLSQNRTITFATITPEEAAYYLAKYNPSNRNINISRVRKYTETMRKGHWRSESDSMIGFDRDGNIVNGQHRLSAMVESNTKQSFIVQAGLPASAKEIQDKGFARTLQDTLRFNGCSTGGSYPAGITRNWFRSENSWSSTPLEEDLKVCFEQNKEAILAIANSAKPKSPYSKIGFLLGCAQYYQKNSEKALEFLSGVVNGVDKDGNGFKGNSPIFRLREYINRIAGAAGDAALQDLYYRTLYCIHSFHLGNQPVARISKKYEFEF